MAIRAKLSPLRDTQTIWPWHEVNAAAISAAVLGVGERRMEAASYLSSGYGLRLAFDRFGSRVTTVGRLAKVWQPSRLKGIQLDKASGIPFLAATQVFDLRPSPRKFLSLDRTEDSGERFIQDGTIVITCSGSVGRSTLIYGAHKGVLISHDLLRVTPSEPVHWGWVYAYFRSAYARQMMVSAQYGHMIKHLEPSHIDALPIPLPRDEVLSRFQVGAAKVLESRNRAWMLQLRAERMFSDATGAVPVDEAAEEVGFSVGVKDLLGSRRRLEATYHSPKATSIVSQFVSAGLQVQRLKDVTERVWWLSRFKRVFGDEGERYLSADELFSLNPGTTKRVLVEQADNPDLFRVKAGWIVMACSGQTYGLNGSVSLMTKKHESAFFSHDLVRIVCKRSEIRPGYLFTVLGHPQLGRPLVIRNAYGTSIPHLDPEDVADIPVVRLPGSLEDEIASVMEEAIELRVDADALEDELANDADDLLRKFLAGETAQFRVIADR